MKVHFVECKCCFCQMFQTLSAYNYFKLNFLTLVSQNHGDSINLSSEGMPVESQGFFPLYLQCRLRKIAFVVSLCQPTVFSFFSSSCFIEEVIIQRSALSGVGLTCQFVLHGPEVLSPVPFFLIKNQASRLLMWRLPPGQTHLCSLLTSLGFKFIFGFGPKKLA